MIPKKHKRWSTPAISSELSIRDTLAKAMAKLNDGNTMQNGGTTPYLS